MTLYDTKFLILIIDRKDMRKKKIDIRELNEFNAYDDTFRKVYADDENLVYVFRRDNKCYKKPYYEVVKGRKYKKSDGSIIYIYPPSSLFGKIAFCVNSERPDFEERIQHYVEYLTNMKIESNQG